MRIIYGVLCMVIVFLAIFIVFLKVFFLAPPNIHSCGPSKRYNFNEKIESKEEAINLLSNFLSDITANGYILNETKMSFDEKERIYVYQDIGAPIWDFQRSYLNQNGELFADPGFCQ